MTDWQQYRTPGRTRIFLVGSGPSLRSTPMDDLIGEDCMAMNKIHKIWTELKWKWRPTHYFKIDYNSLEKMWWKEEIEANAALGIPMFLWSMFQKGYPPGHANFDDMPEGVGSLSNTVWIEKCRHTPYHSGNWKAVQSWHLPSLCTAFTGMSTMLQIAVLMGYEEIYLLGCDLAYTPDRTKNHAIANYTLDTRDKSTMDNGNMLACHLMAKRSSPVPIYNAAPGGSLEVYPRVSLDEILKVKA